MTEYEKLSLRLFGLIANGISLLAGGLTGPMTPRDHVIKILGHAEQVTATLNSVNKATQADNESDPDGAPNDRTV